MPQGRTEEVGDVSDEIVIGEGVVLDARPASFLSRVVAASLDAAVTVVGGGVLAALVFSSGLVPDEAVAAAVTVLLLVALLVGVPTAVETLSRGRSLGKLAMGIRIVRDDGGPVRLRQALLRSLLGVLELWMFAGGGRRYAASGTASSPSPRRRSPVTPARTAPRPSVHTYVQ